MFLELDDIDIPTVPSADDMATLSVADLLAQDSRRTAADTVADLAIAPEEHYFQQTRLAQSLMQQREPASPATGSLDPVLTSTLQLDRGTRLSATKPPSSVAHQPKRYLASHIVPRTESVDHFVRSVSVAAERRPGHDD